MIDVEEVYTIESWMVGQPLKKYKKRAMEKQKDRRCVCHFEQGYVKDVKHKIKQKEHDEKSVNKAKYQGKPVGENSAKKSDTSTTDFLKKLTHNIKHKPATLQPTQRLQSKELEEPSRETGAVSSLASTEQQPDLWSTLLKIDLDLLNKRMETPQIYKEKKRNIPITLSGNEVETSSVAGQNSSKHKGKT